MEMTLLPARFSSRAVGYAIAVPTLPLTITVVPNCSISEGLPRGPTTSRMESPASSRLSSMVVLPMACTQMVMVPAWGSASAMVRGMRSPESSSRTMMNCPGRCFFAMRGALITNSLIFCARGRASTISNTVPSTFDSAEGRTFSLWHTSQSEVHRAQGGNGAKSATKKALVR